ncbi:MAG: HAMP domain-containing histidine kinase [Anaerolineae bacterium]|nr:HAMP domain-containing histidine kinase [Anaerolineae bacterium]
MTETTPDLKRVVVQQGATDAEPLFEVYHLSHDLRGPLNSILGFTELLLEEIEGPLTDIQQEDISAINQSAQNLLRLINNMVDLSKVDAGRLEINTEDVSLHQICRCIMATDSDWPKPDQIELTVDLPETLPLLQADSSRVEQMLGELLGLAFRLKGMGEVIVTANSNGQEVTVGVSVPGVVVLGQELEEYFRLIIKTDAAGRSQLGPGGLGLPLVRRLAEKHKGRVWAEEQAGAGIIFYLSLPAAQGTSRA